MPSYLQKIRSKSGAEIRQILARNAVDRIYQASRALKANLPLALVTSTLYGRPSRRLHLVGITGTNGKGSVAYLVWRALTEMQVPAGIIGTGGVHFPGHSEFIGLTTPPTIRLNQELARMARAGVRACVLEVSSHALVEHRVAGLTFRTAIFTRLEPDHLDYHGTMEAYAAAKARLFRMLDRRGLAILNGDDPAHRQMAEAARSARICLVRRGDTPTQQEGPPVDAAEVVVRILRDSYDGLVLEIDGRALHTSAVGAFNAFNFAQAYVALQEFGLPRQAVISALSRVSTHPGRLERILPPAGASVEGPIVFVDRGQNPDSLRSVLGVLGDLRQPGQTLVCLMSGSAAWPDERLEEMGRIAAEMADEVILTDGNAKADDPARIRGRLAAGFPPGTTARSIPGRREAIRAAVEGRGSEAVVLLAGLGEAGFVRFDMTKTWWSDGDVVREILWGDGVEPSR